MLKKLFNLTPQIRHFCYAKQNIIYSTSARINANYSHLDADNLFDSDAELNNSEKDNDDDFRDLPIYDERKSQIEFSPKPWPTYLIRAVREQLFISEEKTAELIESMPTIQKQSIHNLTRNVHQLTTAGVSIYSILEYPQILLNREQDTRTKLMLLQSMDPRNINDFVPFLQITATKLIEIARSYRREKSVVQGGHRVYFLSDILQISPQKISRYLSFHLFMFTLDYDSLFDKLLVLLKYISPEHIVRDLMVFLHTPEFIENRLKRAKAGHKVQIRPWVVRCQDQILERSVSLTLADKKLLGGKPLVYYVSKRLRFDIVTTKFILDKHPQVYTCRSEKVMKVLDYLLKDEGFTPLDIAQVPRVLCHSLATTKHRLAELKAVGCRPRTLNIICRSTKEYRKYLDHWKKGLGEDILSKSIRNPKNIQPIRYITENRRKAFKKHSSL